MRRSWPVLLACLALSCGKSSAPSPGTGPRDARSPSLVDFQEADIILQDSHSSQSEAIRLATKSPFTHVGLIHFDHGKPAVYEAVGPVKLTPLQEWIDHGQGGHYTLMRLKNAPAVLTPDALHRMWAAGQRFRGKPYDFTFEWSDHRIYCSELVWKVYKEGLGIELAPPQRLGDFDLSHPTVQAKLRERFGNKVPLQEPVVPPSAIAQSPLLSKVREQ